jgi:hypothetical protein
VKNNNSGKEGMSVREMVVHLPFLFRIKKIICVLNITAKAGKRDNRLVNG